MLDIEKLTFELVNISKNNAPVRTIPPSGPHGSSPYPGNLKNNGINAVFLAETTSRVIIGGEPAPYGPYTEKTSFKPGWIAKSVNDFISLLVNQYGGVIK